MRDNRQAQMPCREPATLVAALLAGYVLCACDQPAVPTGDAVPVAKVNADVITLGRLKGALARTSVEPNRTSSTLDEIVEALVDQTLAIEQTKKLELDRAPEVQTAIEEAKREILARAYYDHLSLQVPKPSEENIRRYYLAHPELFAHRCLYSLKELTISNRADAATLIKNARSATKSVDELASWLRLRGIKFQVNSAIRAPESLPLDLLPKLASARLGDMIVYTRGEVNYIAQVVGLLEDPIREADARLRIRSFLENRQAKEAMAEDGKRLRANAKIEIRADIPNMLVGPSPTGVTPALALETRSASRGNQFSSAEKTSEP